MRLVILSLVGLAIALSSFLGFLAGWFYGNEQAYRNRFYEERDALHSVLDDPAFGDVRIERFSGGGADLTGTVGSSKDLERLRSEFVNAIGEAKARLHFIVEVVPHTTQGESSLVER